MPCLGEFARDEAEDDRLVPRQPAQGLKRPGALRVIFQLHPVDEH